MANAQDLLDVSGYNYTEETNTSSEYFKPSPKAGIQGIYKAVVRFVPYLKDKEHSLIKKYECYLKDPEDGSGKYVDSYRSINEKCPIQDAFFECYNSKDATIEQHKDDFSQREQFYANVQILKDPNKPENVGKIMQFKFGRKIKEKLEGEENPGAGKKARNPFDVFEGRPFAIDIYKKGDWPNYDKCEFVNGDDLIDCPLHLGPDKQPLNVTRDNPEDVKIYAEFLLENSPELTKNLFKPWTDQTRDFVNRVINSVFNRESSSQIRANLTVSETAKNSFSNSKKSEPVIEESDPLGDDIEKDMNLSKKSVAKTESDDDLGDILNSVDDIDLDDL